ncbi:MAG: hypothetical protein KIT09_04095 [Bryobacteraceae bacterium]|nr:hypothetical protein [Bryobacteraceae bacterium]
MTRRLYYDDAYLRTFQARVVGRASDGRDAWLDRTAFYPDSGGQPCDAGEIAGVAVTDVADEGDRIRHRLARPVDADEVECSIDWPRRFDHMQQHSGQHLLSAVLNDLFQAPTLSFHLGRDASTIEIGAASLSPEQLRAAEQRANEIVLENRAVRVAYEEAGEARDLRKPSERQGTLRIVSIDNLDRSACGGTHVRSTGEIGAILIRKLEKIRGNLRLEFLCGGRALRRAQSDYDALSQVARLFSAPFDEVPALVAAQQARLAEADKSAKRLSLELAQLRGRALYFDTFPGPEGVKRVVRRLAAGPIPADVRTEAQSFTAGERAWFAALFDDPPSLLLAVSADLGAHAGNLLKAALAQSGGRGGGNARIAQGSVPSRDALNAAWTWLEAALSPPDAATASQAPESALE